MTIPATPVPPELLGVVASGIAPGNASDIVRIALPVGVVMSRLAKTSSWPLSDANRRVEPSICTSPPNAASRRLGGASVSPDCMAVRADATLVSASTAFASSLNDSVPPSAVAWNAPVLP